MPHFVLTAKVLMPLNNGMRIEKGQKFEVDIPWAHLPFDSIQCKDLVSTQLRLRGFEIKGHESYLSGAYFEFKKV